MKIEERDLEKNSEKKNLTWLLYEQQILKGSQTKNERRGRSFQGALILFLLNLFIHRRILSRAAVLR